MRQPAHGRFRGVDMVGIWLRGVESNAHTEQVIHYYDALPPGVQ